MTRATEVIGPVQGEGADTAPLPTQLRDDIRTSKAESILQG